MTPSTTYSAFILSTLFVSFIGSLGQDKIEDQSLTFTPKETKVSKASQKSNSILPCSNEHVNIEFCPSETRCDQLGNECLKCQSSIDCHYGEEAVAECEVPEGMNCTGDRKFQRSFSCAFCYQTKESTHSCEENVNCDSISDPNHRHYVANCTVENTVLCFGRRHFHKQKLCNWTGGHRWITALILSITLGGFGADR